MSERLIVEQSEFEELCEHARAAGIVAFDTEFVSEDTYRPELCLMQFATRERSVAVDPFAIQNLDAWWNVMADAHTTVVVHGGQAEIQFCLSHAGRRPQKLVDVQMAEGLRTTSYPLGYSALVNRVLGVKVHNKETRTDWRRRPLTTQQIDYAIADVNHLLPIWDAQRKALERLGRLDWAQAEFQRMIEDLDSEETREGWRRLSGIHRLNRRELAIAVELWHWRNEEAQRRNRPVRRTLRDDLIVDLAHRQPKDARELLSVRDMNRSGYKRVAQDLVDRIDRALALPDDQLPHRSAMPKQDKNPDEQVLGQLLAIALSNRCEQINVARQLVGTSSDLRALVRRHVFHESDAPEPRLMTGWRAEVCGNLLTDLLDGKISLRVADPQSDSPLAFDATPEK